MSLQRNAKKAAYVIVPILLLVGLFAVPATLRQLNSPNTLPQITPTPYLPIDVEEVSVIPHPVLPTSDKRTFDIVAKVHNPNPRAGLASYTLRFVLLDTTEKEITTVEKEAYVLPGSVQYVTVLNVSFPRERQLGRVQIDRPTEEVFVRLPETVDLPSFSLFLQERQERQTGGTPVIVQGGIVRNTGTFDWQRVEVRAVALDSSGGVIGVGETFVGRLLVGEQREFALEWPKGTETIQQVIAVPSTNIFKEENVVEIIGDPARLR
ncbi:MAG: hypothetical protein WD200_05025 [Candidatus Andersenbacteria bacterium]